jgi:tetratricopeptide (TPR) repeat protein
MSALDIKAQELRGQLQSLGRALELAPQDVTLMRRFAEVLRELGARREALALYARAVELDPGSAERLCELGALHAELRHHEEAASAYAAALALRPDHVAAQVGKAALLRLRGLPREAETVCRAALAVAPDDVDAWTLLGELCADGGRFGEAEDCFRQALRVQPESCGALIGIATHRKMTAADAGWRRRVEALLARALPLRHEIGLRYALGKYCDDVGEYGAAFAQYAAANELGKRQTPAYDGAKFSRRVDALIAGVDAAAIARAHAQASPSEQPVFVVGMPRSGTSLLEQILASHPDIVGVGEQAFWDAAFIRLQKCGPDREAIAQLLPGIAADYLALIGPLAAEARRVVDKMPANFLYAGLIHSVFPRARIIHLQRHPIDTCLSIYFQNFAHVGAYAKDLGSLAHYYREYRRITDHWRGLLPTTALFELSYEALIADTEGCVRRLLDFLGLAWDPRCLEFHATERTVITASKWQVRQKIHGSSAGRWRHYESFVGPLRGLLQEPVATTLAGSELASHPSSPRS